MIYRFNIIFILLFSNLIASGLEHDSSFVKSVYIEKISRFLTWPDDKENSKEFNLCITGDSAVEKYLPRLYRKRTIKKKPVKIIRIDNFDEAFKCHMMYVNSKNINQLAFLQEFSVVLIGNSSGLEHKGVHINFFDEGERVRFWINPKSYKGSGIRVNHLLLSIAKIVR